jgi:predicted restriction endonuclease
MMLNNGLLLCANMHSYFDKHLLKLKIIDYNNCIVSVQIDKKLKDCQIYKYNGLIITLLSENIKYIEKRYSSISKNLHMLE